MIVGEALVDCFEDRPPIVGGAPLNVAWNLTGFGHSPVFVSRVALDETGDLIVDEVHRWGMATQNMRPTGGQANTHPTGTVQVEVRDGQPSYDIVYPVAYDFLPGPNDVLNGPFAKSRLLYLGSLAWRRPESHSVLQAWIDTGMRRFVDINLRAPWYEAAVIDRLANGASVLKLNDDELALLSSQPATGPKQIAEAVSSIRNRWSFDVALVTCGASGAYAITPTQQFFAAAPSVTDIADTVGAGDAFASSVIDGMLRGYGWQRCLNQAVQFAAKLCSINGATSTDRSLYERELNDEDTHHKGIN